jgi:uridine kinase
VLLGSAGSGKTIFAKWLICLFARALRDEEKHVTIQDKYYSCEFCLRVALY